MTAAVRIHKFGPPSVMVFEEIPRPIAGPGQVLVEVRAAGVGSWDVLVRNGRSALPQPLPLTLGSDLAGIVLEVGKGVDSFSHGDAVFGVTNRCFTGAYARHAVAAADMLALKPAPVPFAEAASAPVAAVTAWQMLFDHGGVAEGTRVLVHGGTGSVGAYAVQLAHRAGAIVVAMISEPDAAYVRSLGADEVHGYGSDCVTETIAPVDVVIDTIGGAILEQSFALVRPGGIVVSSVSPPPNEAASRSGVRGGFFIVDVTRSYLEPIAELLASGELVANIGLVVPLAEAQHAHRLLERRSRRPRGKIVLRTET